jgi:glucose/mannose-6-phosphate isomerase
MSIFLLFVGLMENDYMHGLIANFSKHLAEAISIGSKAQFKRNERPIANVVVCGLGGSGIGGTNVQKILKEPLKAPFHTNKGYHLPGFVNENTLVICCSYSGNTEETLAMYQQAQEKGAEIAIVCSGGKFQEIAEKEGLNHIIIPGGLPPRAAFGLAFPQLFFVLHQYGLISDFFVEELSNSIRLMDDLESTIREEAKELAKFLLNKIPVLYSESRWEGVLVRFRQQLNENAKMLAWHHVIPEMNHNELVGWRERSEQLAVVFFKDEEDYYRNQKRFDYAKGVISSYTSNIAHIGAKGNSFLEKCIYWIHLGDWTSYYLAELKNIDSVEVEVISGLKNMLADLD